jgi:hypothetical protein
MNYNNKNEQVEIGTIKMLSDSQKDNIRNEIKELDDMYVHLLSSGSYDEMKKLRSKMASLEIKLR